MATFDLLRCNSCSAFRLRSEKRYFSSCPSCGSKDIEVTARVVDDEIVEVE